MPRSSVSFATRVAVLATAMVATGACAHELRPKVVREIVRMQGYLGAPPAGTAVQRELTLVVLGERFLLRVTDAQVLRTGEAGPAAAEPDEIRLQGDRSMLAQIPRLSSQRLTLLAERRPGAAEVFLLALDVCPPLGEP